MSCNCKTCGCCKEEYIAVLTRTQIFLRMLLAEPIFEELDKEKEITTDENNRRLRCLHDNLWSIVSLLCAEEELNDLQLQLIKTKHGRSEDLVSDVF